MDNRARQVPTQIHQRESLDLPMFTIIKRLMLVLGLVVVLVVLLFWMLLYQESTPGQSGPGTGLPEAKKAETPELTVVQRLQAKGADVSLNARGDIVRLSYRGRPLSEDDLQLVCTFAELEELDLSEAILPEKSVGNLSQLLNLEKLNLSRAKLAKNVLESLRKIPRLRSIDLSGVQQISFPEIRSGDFPEVESLNLSGTQFVEGSYDEIVKLPKLEIIRFSEPGQKEPFSFTVEQVRALKKVAHPLLLSLQTVNENGIKELESANENIIVETVIVSVSLRIGDKNFDGPPLMTDFGMLRNHPAPNDEGFINWLTQDVMLVLVDPDAAENEQLLLEFKRDNISRFRLGKVTRRLSDKTVRAEVSFVADEKYGVKGYVEYKPFNNDAQLKFHRFIPSFVFESAELDKTQTRFLSKARKAVTSRRLPLDEFALVHRKTERELVFQHKGTESLRQVDARITVFLENENPSKTAYSWDTLKQNDERIVSIHGAGAVQKATLLLTAKTASEPVIYHAEWRFTSETKK